MQFLQNVQTTLRLKALALEETCGDLIVRLGKPSLTKEPFSHVIIDDLLPHREYTELVTFARSVRARGISPQKNASQFIPFLDISRVYDGYVYVPKLEELPLLSFFFSHSWNLFIRTLFGRPTVSATSLGLHYHPAGDRSGWVHHDHALRSFHRGAHTPNGIFTEVSEQSRTDTFMLRRDIALLYYFDNEPSEGGGTALYADQHGSPHTVVEAKNNRLLAFQISPQSYHAFVGNTTPRSSLIQWFFTEPNTPLPH